MPLLDHFHAPLAPPRKWESFHTIWSALLAERLNDKLPQHYYAETQVHFGSRIEVDIATVEYADGNGAPMNSGATALAVETYAPPAATTSIPAVFPDDIEVRVFHDSGGATLVGAIEMVSPGNKDRPESRRAFAAKCAAYLHRGVGLVVVDVVTERHANLHDELMELLRRSECFGVDVSNYATAYRPVHRDTTGNQIEMWLESLTLGEALPTLPLWIRGGPVLPVEFEWTYTEARRRARI